MKTNITRRGFVQATAATAAAAALAGPTLRAFAEAPSEKRREGRGRRQVGVVRLPGLHVVVRRAGVRGGRACRQGEGQPELEGRTAAFNLPGVRTWAIQQLYDPR